MKTLPLIFSLLIFPAAFVSAPLVAQEESAEAGQEPVKVAQTKIERKTKSKTEAKSADKSTDTQKSNVDDYKSTEEISEDLSVSYPVDI